MPRVLAVFLSASILAGCVTPVIPLPPPQLDDLSLAVTDPQKDLVTITGKPVPHFRSALIYIFNLDTLRGQIIGASADGSFTSDPFVARDGHRIDIWASRGSEEEPSSTLQAAVRGGKLIGSP